MNVVRIEQTKLTASYLNGVAVAFLAVGGIGPVLAFSAGEAARVDLPSTGVLAVGCLAVSVVSPYIISVDGYSEISPMLNYEFLLIASIAPAGALLIGLWFIFESHLRHRRDAKRHHAAE